MSAAWLEEQRREAAARYDELGLPTTRLEDWRYTNVGAIAKTEWVPGKGRHDDVTPTDIEHLTFPVFACSLFVFVNGHFAGDLSSPRALAGGVEVTTLKDALRDDPESLRGRLGALADTKRRAFAALNLARFEDGALVRIPAGAQLEMPIHLVFLSEPGSSPTASHPRTLVVAESGSRATVIEDYVTFGDGEFLTNAVTELFVEANADLEHVRFQRESAHGHHVSSLHLRQERDSRLAAHSISLGAALTRNDVEAALVGEGAHTDLYGLFLGTGDRLVDNHTTVDHAVPHTTSQELYKGILGGSSRGVFHGRVIVRPDAQKIDARQASKNLLLSDGAEINTKPQLEIHADDVKCSHGSTIGRLDPDALFYLRARGIDEEQARALLTRAFASEVTDTIRSDVLRQRVQDQLLEILESE